MRIKFYGLIISALIAITLGGSSFAQIISEQPGGVAERVYFQYDIDAQVTLNSYTVAKVTSQSTSPFPPVSCTGTMVGPNVMLSASHCHGDRKTAVFRAYVSENDQRTESFNCDYLFHTWPETDISVHWCFANNAGENPGDKWGYVDYELDILPNGQVNHNRSRDFVQPDDDIYSIWWNPIDDIGGDHLLYSEGRITDIFVSFWANPGGDHCEQNDDVNIGIHSNVWGAGGASGSLQISAITGRVLLAPLSLASSGASGGPSRTASSLVDMLDYARIWDTRVENPLMPPGCKGRLEPYINVRALQTLWNDGIHFDDNWSNFTKYLGKIDKNLNGVVDIQEDLERAAGEGPRDFYYINFNSQRQNAQGTYGPSAAVNWFGFLGSLMVDDLRDLAHPDDDALQQPRLLYHHTGLNLDPASYYRVLVNSRGSEATEDTLRVCMEECRLEDFGSSLRDTSVSEFSAGGDLLVSSHSKAPAIIWDITISTPDTVFDFDTADKRRIWSRLSGPPAGLEPAFIWPQGRTTGRGVDWAGVVRDNQRDGEVEFSLATHLIPIPPGTADVCFYVLGLEGSDAPQMGVFRLVSSNTNEVVFEVEDGVWNEVCLEDVEIAADGSDLLFGSIAAPGFRYAVDDITINLRQSIEDAPQDGDVAN